MSLVKFDFSINKGEQLDVIAKVPEDKRGVIHGVVVDECNRPICDAVVKLFEIECHSEKYNIIPITHTFTDDLGNFLFGPLCNDRKYMVKIWVNDVKTKCKTFTFERDHDCLKGKKCPPKPCCEKGLMEEEIKEEVEEAIEEILEEKREEHREERPRRNR